ncbi:hypothetical protein OSB04_031134 [Centaurea solstitialis]|uniref:Uncharacterized protein n=1 Tax=Centaurea solstitialis TaxID=347529 RepID=A0AA38W7U0_9ASTR|nr:hypothetical protein OSB04_031134 [Centaurea solstitialis]
MPSRVIGFSTPLQKLQELVQQPINLGLEPQIFGCTAYVHQNIGKLEPRAVRCDKLLIKRVIGATSNRKNESSLQGERNEEVNTLDTESNRIPKKNLKRNKSNWIPKKNQKGSDDDNTIHDRTNNLTNNEGVMSDVVQESEPHAQEHAAQDQVHAGSNSEPRFPVRSTRGTPKMQYQADLKAKDKYPIGNYVSQHRLASSHMVMINELSTVLIPRDVYEAMKDGKMEEGNHGRDRRPK